MRHEGSASDGGSIVRSVLVGIGFVALFAMGQWVAALILSVSYGSADVLARLRRNQARGNVSNMSEIQEVRTVETRTSGSSHVRGDRRAKDDIVVEKKPRKDAKGDSSDQSEKKDGGGISGKYTAFMDKHPSIKAFIGKIGKDNVGMLAGYLSWNLLTSMVPLIAGLIAITGFILRDSNSQQAVINHLTSTIQGISQKEAAAIIHGTVQHSGLFGIIGFLGVLWGGSNVGGAISTIFQAIFEVTGRSFIKEKLIDIGMIFVFSALMIVIVVGSAAAPLLSGLISLIPLPGVAFAVGLLITFVASCLLFALIYLVFPNIEPPFRFGNVWRGAVVAAVLFTILSQVWNIYAQFQHFNKYGAILSALLVLTAWLYFFSMILVVGAEVVAYYAIEEAKREGREIGPQPEESVPQHDVLRKQPVTQQ